MRGFERALLGNRRPPVQPSHHRNRSAQRPPCHRRPTRQPTQQVRHIERMPDPTVRASRHHSPGNRFFKTNSQPLASRGQHRQTKQTQTRHVQPGGQPEVHHRPRRQRSQLRRCKNEPKYAGGSRARRNRTIPPEMSRHPPPKRPETKRSQSPEYDVPHFPALRIIPL